MSKNIIIAIDGPAASGKSTVAKILAAKLGYSYINSGHMYRAITYKCLQNGIESLNIDDIIKTTQETAFSVVDNQLLVDGQDYSEKVIQQDVATTVSTFAMIPELRDLLILKQRELSEKSSVIMDGRDISTVVFPKATYKFYLDASVEVRAERRYAELLDKFPDKEVSLIEIQNELVERDRQDTERAVSPLSIAKDALVIDTSKISIEKMVITLYNILLTD